MATNTPPARFPYDPRSDDEVRDAATGRTLGDLRNLADEALPGVPAWAKSAAVDICRAYGFKGASDPAYLANLIARASGHLPNPDPRDDELTFIRAF